MTTTRRSAHYGDGLRVWAACLGATGVGLGALGAHAIHDKLVQRGMLDAWRTGILYQLFHAVAVLGVAAWCEAQPSSSSSSAPTAYRYVRHFQISGQVMSVGSLLFSGSIYCLCLGVGPKKIMGPTTPLGGLLMVGGWLMLLWPPSDGAGKNVKR